MGIVLTDHVRCDEFGIPGIFGIAQDKDDLCRFSGAQLIILAMAGDGIPAAGNGLTADTCLNAFGFFPAAEAAGKLSSVTVVTVAGGSCSVEGVVIPPLPVFGFVINDTWFDLNFTGTQVALVVLRIIHCIPQAPFHGSIKGQFLWLVGFVGDADQMQLAGFPQRHRQGDLGFQSILFPFEDAVTDTVPAPVDVRHDLAGQKGRTPGGLSLFPDIKEAAAHIAARFIVAETDQASEPGILIETVATAGIGDKAEEIF